MQTRKLGYSDLNLTTVGLGTWAIGGGGWAYGWGPQDDAESMAAIRRALDLGINYRHQVRPGLGRGQHHALWAAHGGECSCRVRG
jgi:hypothetical protein